MTARATTWRERVALAWSLAPRARDGAVLLGLALLFRLGVVAWAWGEFPPVDDGRFYDVVAGRIAQGLGYTWLWPDGAVTYAAHYPVGYPALIGSFYAVFGPRPVVAMLFNAALGAAGTWAVYRVAAAGGLRGPALLAGGIAAAHPGFLFYTPALMTEGVTAALLALVGAVAVIAREHSNRRAPLAWLVAAGVLSGVVALVRPQTVVLAPVFGAFAWANSWKTRALGAALVTALALLTTTPWTLRNCARFERCVFVSANGGWNLLIGSAEKATGRWVPIDALGVPEECRTVFEEAAKDQCFGRVAARNVSESPGRFLALVPRKLAATFDWIGAPGHYLHASNPARFSYRAKVVLGVVEAAVERLVVLLALVGLARAPGPNRALRLGVSLFGMVWLFHEHAWVAYAALIVASALAGLRLFFERPGVAFGVSVVAATALTHAVFFGDGRYGLVTGLALIPLAVEAFHRANLPGRELFRRSRAA